MGTGWEDLDLEDLGDGRFTTSISDTWMLAVAPQGGAVAAIAVRAMERVLGIPEQSLRTLTVMFAGVVRAGAVEVDAQVVRRGRSMSQLRATVRNPDAEAGLTAIAAFGAPRRGFEFTELAMPVVTAAADLRGYRDPIPDDVDFEFDGDPWPFWERILECRPAISRAPWEPFEEGPAEVAHWYRLDHPPLAADGSLDVTGLIVMGDTMPGPVGQKLGPQDPQWFAPSVDFTFHALGNARPGWLLAHQKARHAGGGYASVESALWDPTGPTLVGYCTQMMLFTFM
jgi:acyl-CoA thioesterase